MQVLVRLGFIAQTGVILGVKNSQKAPRFVPFCSMYGNVLSYPIDHAGLAAEE